MPEGQRLLVRMHIFLSRFSVSCDSRTAASDSWTTRTGTSFNSARAAARNLRASAMTSQLLISTARTSKGCKTPCVLKLSASSCKLRSSKRWRGLVGDSCNCARGRLQYSGERKGRSAVEVCTSAARKIGETLAPRDQGRAPSMSFVNGQAQGFHPCYMSRCT